MKKNVFLIAGLIFLCCAVLVGRISGKPEPTSKKQSHPSYPSVIFAIDADGSVRGPLFSSLQTAIYQELKGKQSSILKAITVISNSHRWLVDYFWPEDDYAITNFFVVKRKILQIKKEWDGILREVSNTEKELMEKPIIRALIGDINKAFEGTKRALPVANRKGLSEAYKILHDLKEMWQSDNPPTYGVTATEKVLRDMMPEHLQAVIEEIKEDMLAGVETGTVRIFPCFEYDEENQRFVHTETGVWFLSSYDGALFIVPPEQYVKKEDFERINACVNKNWKDIWRPYGIEIRNRPNEVWQLIGYIEVVVREGDTYESIKAKLFEELQKKHFRMNWEWYEEQVKEINGIKDVNLIRAGDILKFPLYVDRESLK